MSHDVTRRALVRGAATLPAIAALPVAAASTEPDDPIYTVIEAHNEAWRILCNCCEALEEAGTAKAKARAREVTS
jgi:hypothetical protein